MRPFPRRDVQDGERDVARDLDEKRAPLDMPREAEKVGESLQVAAHGAGGTQERGAAVMMAWAGLAT